jgi:hypothetical protein
MGPIAPGARVARVLQSPYLKPIILVIILIVLWDLSIRIFRIPPYQVPPPGAVLTTLFQEGPELLSQTWPITVATLWGFALSVVVGIPLAMLRPARIEPVSARIGRSCPIHVASFRRISISSNTRIDPAQNPMIPHIIVLEPGLIIYKIYNGYWFFDRPTIEELRHDLRAVTMKCRPARERHAGMSRLTVSRGTSFYSA